MPETADTQDPIPATTANNAKSWIERWDRQQELYIAEREDRFTALIDAVEAGTGRPDPLVIDLGCGPGSLAVRLLQRLPEATVIAVDADPVTLSLGRAAYNREGDGIPGLRFADADLRSPDWAERIGLPDGRPVDAAVSSTALHWLSQVELTGLYAVLARLLKPGGLFLDADHFQLDEEPNPVLSRLDQAREEKESQRRSAGQAEDWEQWWRAAAGDTALAGAAEERERRGVAHHGPESARLAVHTTALRAAGFAETGTLWQRGASRLLCAVR